MNDRMTDASGLRPGDLLDRYELLSPLAEGGMAAVWLARMKGKWGFEKLVAIKTIKPQFSEDERFEQMFLDEARIASGIHHPNVAQIIDLGEQDDILYLVMEYVDGESLSRTRRAAAKAGEKVPLGLALRITADLCAGLHAAHELRDLGGVNLGVVHRDVSPQNVLITTAGAVKVIDFGIAKAHNRGSAETSAGFFKGKAHYMAPEQLGSGAIDRRVDIWAAGVVLYELISGQLPYAGETQIETFELVASGKPPPPLVGVPDHVEEVIRHSLAHAPAARFSTAVAMQRAIETTLSLLNLPTTSDDVAAFVDRHLRERTAKRQRLVQAALATAGRRSQAPTPVPAMTDDPPEAPTRAMTEAVTRAMTEAPTHVMTDAVTRARLDAPVSPRVPTPFPGEQATSLTAIHAIESEHSAPTGLLPAPPRKARLAVALVVVSGIVFSGTVFFARSMKAPASGGAGTMADEPVKTGKAKSKAIESSLNADDTPASTASGTVAPSASPSAKSPANPPPKSDPQKADGPKPKPTASTPPPTVPTPKPWDTPVKADQDGI